MRDEISTSLAVSGAPPVPLVSVVMPVRNEVCYIDRSLDAVFAQDYPNDRLEVIVADGMSTDGTRARVEAIQARRPRVLLVDNPRRTAPSGLNAALRVARGEIVIRVDGHCEIARDYVTRCVSYLSGGGADAVGGPITTVGENPLAEAIAAAMSSPFGVGGSAFRTVRNRTLFVDTVAFPAYRRDLLERLGPFDEELVRNQDDEYNYRLRKSGGRVLLASDGRRIYWLNALLRFANPRGPDRIGRAGPGARCLCPRVGLRPKRRPLDRRTHPSPDGRRASKPDEVPRGANAKFHSVVCNLPARGTTRHSESFPETAARDAQ